MTGETEEEDYYSGGRVMRDMMTHVHDMYTHLMHVMHNLTVLLGRLWQAWGMAALSFYHLPQTSSHSLLPKTT